MKDILVHVRNDVAEFKPQSEAAQLWMQQQINPDLRRGKSYFIPSEHCPKLWARLQQTGFSVAEVQH